MSEENFEPTTTEKTPEQTDRIMAGIDQNELLSGCAIVVTRRHERPLWSHAPMLTARAWPALQPSRLSAEQKKFVLGAMIEVSCDAEDVIISQGEDGDHFYLVDSGTYEVFLKQAEDGKPVATYESGKSFGELALLYNSPRAATITCKTAGTLWALERKAFRHVMVNTGAGDLKAKAENFLKTVEILSPLTDAQRASLASVMEELVFADGEQLSPPEPLRWSRHRHSAPAMPHRRVCGRDGRRGGRAILREAG